MTSASSGSTSKVGMQLRYAPKQVRPTAGSLGQDRHSAACRCDCAMARASRPSVLESAGAAVAAKRHLISYAKAVSCFAIADVAGVGISELSGAGHGSADSLMDLAH
jgi:hypothetical protein